ncbi:MAG: hypothetical protein ACW98X_17810 [Promethearchaeota archaeon]|jgi:hypothetical protein
MSKKLYDTAITFHCTKQQKKDWKERAKSQNKTLSEWIRNKCEDEENG